MAKELPYLPTYKNVGKLFEAIESAKKPDVLTTRVLGETFGIKGTGDRPLISLLKTLGFLDQSGKPTASYDLLKNSGQAPRAIAEGIRRAYQPLFEANESAHLLAGESLRGLIAQVTGADKGVTGKIAGTLNALLKLADFSDDDQRREKRTPQATDEFIEEDFEEKETHKKKKPSGLRSEFHYNIQVHLPSNGSEETYLNIFNAIRKTFE